MKLEVVTLGKVKYNAQVRLDQAGAFCLSRQELYNSETLRGKTLPLNSSVSFDALSSGLTPGDCIQWERFVMETEKEQRKLWRDEEWLREQYLNNHLPGSKMAEIAGCYASTIFVWLRRFDIPVRDKDKARQMVYGDRLYTDREWLIEHYHEKGMSTGKIAKLCNCGDETIRKWMIGLGVPRRKKKRSHTVATPDRPWRSRGWLHRQYVDNKLSAPQIADKFGTTKETVRKWLHRHRIPVRSGSEMMKLVWDGDEERKEEYRIVQKKRWELGICGSEESLIRLGASVRRAWQEGRISRKNIGRNPSRLELRVGNAMDKMGIPYTHHYCIKGKRWVYDYFIEPNILIEVNGTYWHAHPDFYNEGGKLYKHQRTQKKRDKRKAEYARQHGYILVVLWEHDLHDFGTIVSIKKYILPLIGGGHE